MPKIFCALDTSDLDQAKAWAKEIGPVTGGLKLGMEFFNSFGPHGVEAVREACPDAALFIDLKFHDIPNTVAGAVLTISTNLAPAYLNVHSSGGQSMIEDAVAACAPPTKLLGVTILTSLSDQELHEVGYEKKPINDHVQNLARLSQEYGLAGVVCSGHEIELIREVCGQDFVLMVPGIRPAHSATNDQTRVMTPPEAIDKGATHLVIGRPITKADDPAKAAAEILDSLP